MNYLPKQKGFTLIELLLTVALIGITVGVTTDIILSITKSYNKTQVTNEIEQNANFVLLKLERELRNAISVGQPFANGSTSMSLPFVDKNNQDVTYTVVFPAGAVPGYITRTVTGAGTSTYELTNNYVPSGVSVTCHAASPDGNSSSCFYVEGTSPVRVRLALDFAQAGSAGGLFFTGNVSLDNTIVVRGTY
jgi:prepilin-type N-terminal cleavage/methylation domain-containing protein